MTAKDKIGTIGILTGGGDVPGLNPCIKAIVNRAVDEGMRVFGIKKGWAGLVEYHIEDESTHDENIVPLDKGTVRTIDRSGGTILHTSRTRPSAVKRGEMPLFLDAHPTEATTDTTPHILKNLEHLGIDLLFPIGGDDTLSYGERLSEEGFPVIAIPKTMDNDVFGTDYCIGFSTAITRSVNFIHALRTSTGSHERIGVIELFGRNCGETSLISAYLAGADRALISEVPFDPDKLAEKIMEDKRANPSNYAMLTISEGAKMVGGKVTISEGAKMVGGKVHEYGEEDAYGHRKLGGIGIVTGDALKELTGQGIIFQQLSYLMRSGTPDSLDLMVAINYANMAVNLAKKGVSGRMVALSGGTYADVPISTVTSGQKRVDVRELYDVEEYRPKARTIVGKPMFLY
ncbi:MAG: 6-phosphofructokinase [Deltaproteobacteria bacterium]|nr:6-phosphofructokinase [Deltaproteobacteria bacterium]